MSRPRTFSEIALVLKRSNTGEADRVVTLLSAARGKFAVLAKGARRLNSSRRALLEPGSLIKGFFATTQVIPLLIQAQLLEDTALIRGNLVKLRQLAQILEILDRLFVEEEIEPTLFDLVTTIRRQVVSPRKTSTTITRDLNRLIEALGYQGLNQTTHTNILDYIAEITERPMKSWEYLLVK